MNKKSQIGLILAIVILLIFLGVSMGLYFGGEGLLGTLAKGFESLADRVLGKMPREDIKKPRTTVDEEAENFFYKIMKISDLKTDEVCITKHEEFPEDIGKYELVLSKKEEDTSVRLFNEKKQSIKGETMEGKVPCIITKYDAKDGISYEILDSAILKTDKRFWFDSLHIKGKGDIKDNNLLVVDKDKFCFVSISNVDELYNNLKKCEGFAIPIEKIDEEIINLAKEEFNRFKEFISKSQEEKGYDGICKEPFSFNIKKISTGFYIVFDQESKKVSLYFNEKNFGKLVDEFSLNKKLPIFKLDSEYNFKTNFQYYEELTENFLISPFGGHVTNLYLKGGLHIGTGYVLVNNEEKWAITNLNYWISGNFKKCS